jgi:Arc/MetJ-type ribon-helix-helix transcriptional regulator
MSTGKKTAGAKVSEDVHNRIEELCERRGEGTNKSDVIEDALKSGLDQMEQPAGAEKLERVAEVSSVGAFVAGLMVIGGIGSRPMMAVMSLMLVVGISCGAGRAWLAHRYEGGIV